MERVTAKGHEISSWGEENALELDSGDGFTTLWIYLKPLNHMYTLKG